MFVFGLASLALFSVMSIVLGKEDARHPVDPRVEIAHWTLFNIR